MGSQVFFIPLTSYLIALLHLLSQDVVLCPLHPGQVVPLLGQGLRKFLEGLVFYSVTNRLYENEVASQRALWLCSDYLVVLGVVN